MAQTRRLKYSCRTTTTAAPETRLLAKFLDGAEQLAAGDLTDQLTIFYHWTATFVFQQHVLGHVDDILIGMRHYQVVAGHVLPYVPNAAVVVDRWRI